MPSTIADAFLPRRWATAATLALCLCTAPTALGQGSKADAESLFQAGKALMAEGKLGEACPKFVASNKADPSPGTLLNLGKCYEGLGRYASAWAEYKEAAAMARARNREDQEAAAREGASALEPKLSKLTIQAPKTQIPGLVVKRDGVELNADVLGTPIAVDGGEHVVEASAPGYQTWSGKVTVGRENDKQTLAIGELVKAPEPPPGDPGAGAGAGAGPDQASGGGGLRTVGFITAGAGVAFLGLGAIFGLMASGQASDAENDATLCPNKQCTPAGRDEIDGAETKALVSTIGFVVGGAAIAGGVVMILVGGKKGSEAAAARPAPVARVVPAIGPSGGGLSLSGSF
jgi:hypothetical protein